MLMPSIFGENVLDGFFGSAFDGFSSGELMKTDIKEIDNGYELTMNMPGVKKENVKAELKKGYLTINASMNTDHDEKDHEGRYIRRERYSGSCSRSFYVGENVKEEDIKGSFDNGILKFFVPKKEETKEVEQKRYIPIEG